MANLNNSNEQAFDLFNQPEIELWKSVVGYEDSYEVSSFGRIRSLLRYTTVYFPKKGFTIIRPEYSTFIKGRINNDGYMRISLCLNGKRMSYSVHRLVALAFIPNPDNKPTVNHRDGNKVNNKVYNLEWATHKEQSQHASINRLYINAPKGSRNPKTNLTEEVVLNLLIENKNGTTPAQLHRKYGINLTVIYKITQRRTWRHVKMSD